MSEKSKTSCGGFCWSARDVVFLLIIVASVILIINVRSNRAPAETPALFAQGLTFTQAMGQSEASGRPVLVYATASWCGPCQSFKRGALSDPEVGRVIRERTLPVYLDIDENREVAGMLGVNSVPRMILMRGHEILASHTGVMSAGETIDFVERNTKADAVSSGD